MSRARALQANLSQLWDWLTRLLLTAQSVREKERLAHKALTHSSERKRERQIGSQGSCSELKARKRERLAHKALAHSASERERDWLKRLLITAQSKSERERLAYKALAHSSEHTVLSLTFNVDEPKKMANLRHKLTPHFMPRWHIENINQNKSLELGYCGCFALLPCSLNLVFYFEKSCFVDSLSGWD